MSAGKITARPTAAAVERALDEPQLRWLQLVQLALTLGVALFGGVVVVLYATGSHGTQPLAPPLPAQLLSIINLLFLLVATVASERLFRGLLAAAPPAGVSDPAQALLARLRQAWVVRLALREASALLGLVVCLLLLLDGTLRSEPSWWVNLVAPAAFLSFSLRSFPSRERLLQLLREQLMGLS